MTPFGFCSIHGCICVNCGYNNSYGCCILGNNSYGICITGNDVIGCCLFLSNATGCCLCCFIKKNRVG